MRCTFLSLALLAVFASNLRAATVVPIAINATGGLWNTGFSAAGAQLGNNLTDPHYSITGPDGGPSAAMTLTSIGGFPIPPWLGNDAASDWDAQSFNGGRGAEGTGAVDNVTTFTSTAPGIVTITGQWAADDNGPSILLNGVVTGAATTPVAGNSFENWSSFTITGTVIAGVNSLDFINVNGGDPGGVRVEFFTASVLPTPEPASLVALLGLCGMGLVGLVWRRRKNA